MKGERKRFRVGRGLRMEDPKEIKKGRKRAERHIRTSARRQLCRTACGPSGRPPLSVDGVEAATGSYVAGSAHCPT